MKSLSNSKVLGYVRFLLKRLLYTHQVKKILAVDRIPSNALFLIDGYQFLNRILENSNHHIYIDEYYVKLLVKNIIIVLENYEDLYVADEIFVKNDYQIDDMVGNTIVIDVGMHVGMASLFFAQQEETQQVYSFEPLPQTYEQALKNILINDKNIQDKIKVFNIGLGNTDKIITVDYSYRWKGSVGLMGLSAAMKKNDPNYKQVKIHIEDVVVHVNTILKRHPKAFIIMKLDCEGAEYEIIDRLMETELIHTIHTFIIEWHESMALKLLQSLEESGFEVIIKGDIRKSNGIIKAINKQHKNNF